MQLIYCYIQKFRNIEQQEIQLSDKFRVGVIDGNLRIERLEPSRLKDYVYGQNFVRNLHVIVGKTGSGKTNLLQMIGMDKWERMKDSKDNAYFMLYETSSPNTFFAEIVGLQIQSLQGVEKNSWAMPDNSYAYKFIYDFEEKRIVSVLNATFKETEDTCIVNAFDRYAFAHCPYADEHNTGFYEESGFLPRMVAQFGKSSVSLECTCLQDYLAHFCKNNLKRKASFVIRWDNWQNQHRFELDEKLMRKDYWTYKSRAEEQREKSYKAGKYHGHTTYPKGSTPKSRFLHDLMTDFAIYLRKWAECVDEDFPEKYHQWSGYIDDLGIDNPRILPDGQKMSILKRIDWLCQYLDYHTDEMTSNHGLIWQAGSDVRDLFFLLGKMDDKYFTDEEFSIPVVDIDLSEQSTMQQVFERLEQYRADEVGVFTQCLLPYHWTYVSSGEYQYAKIWGIIEEYGIRVKISSQGTSYNEAKYPNLILLLDEPENYMHPEMCRTFISKMKEILAKRHSLADFQVLLSTHSPFILSDVLSEQVIKMECDELGLCHISQGVIPYFAANIHSIMSDGFFLEYTIGEQARHFLTEKFVLLKSILEHGGIQTEEDRVELQNLRALLPHIGDDVIRFSFESLIKRLQ